MATYVYKYSHPDYEWLYVGKADSTIKERVKAHRKEHKFKPFLNGVKIYYIELDNKAQSKFVESYLIDKYKPYLNKTDKYEGESPFILNLPEWKIYENSLTYEKSNKNLIENEWDKSNKEIERLKKEIENIKFKHQNEIKNIKSEYCKKTTITDELLQTTEFCMNIYKEMNEQNFEAANKWFDNYLEKQEENIKLSKENLILSKDKSSLIHELSLLKQQNKRLQEQKQTEQKSNKHWWKLVMEAILC